MANLDPNEQPLITVRTWTEGDTPVVSLSGELDLTNAKRVQSVIEDTLTGGTERLVIETSELAFMDSSGLALLASVARKVPEIALRDPSPNVRRLIELTGLDEILNVTP
ncbi:MAG: anti-anti-sigma factor [Actinomycetia bacterium]|nr:anti-anti-sigma factor [Actinomycetes bacterium]